MSAANVGDAFAEATHKCQESLSQQNVVLCLPDVSAQCKEHPFVVAVQPVYGLQQVLASAVDTSMYQVRDGACRQDIRGTGDTPVRIICVSDVGDLRYH